MANPDQTPSRSPVERHLTDSQVEHELKLLDTDRLTSVPTPIGELSNIHDVQALRSARTAYDQQVRDAFAGRTPDATAGGTRFADVDPIDATGLFETYKRAYPELVPMKNGKPLFPVKPGQVSKEGVFFDKNLMTGSYASLLVENNSNPAILMAKMQDRFVADNPDASTETRAAFDKALENLTSVLYGQRYDEYGRQCDDLGLTPSEVMRDESNRQNKEDDVKILGRSFGLKKRISKIAQTQQNRLATFTTGAHRLFIAKPVLAWHNRRLKGATHKLDRKDKKLTAANEKLDRSTILSASVKEAIKRERASKLDTLQEKVTSRKDRRDTREAKIRESKGDLAATIELNRRAYREKVESHKMHEQAALANKFLRRELKQSGVNQEEKARILADISPEQLQRIGRVVALEAYAGREVISLSEDHSESTNEVAKFDKAVSDNITETKECRDRIEGLRTALIAFERDKIIPAQKMFGDAREALNKAPTEADMTLERYEELEANFKQTGNTFDKLAAMGENANLQIEKLAKRVTHLEGLKPGLEESLRNAEAQAERIKQALDASRREQSARAEAVSRVAAENITPRDNN